MTPFDPFTGRIYREPPDHWPWLAVALDCAGIALALAVIVAVGAVLP